MHIYIYICIYVPQALRPFVKPCMCIRAYTHAHTYMRITYMYFSTRVARTSRYGASQVDFIYGDLLLTISLVV